MNILFLGDSITDCDHNFTTDNLGKGYVKYLSLFLQDIQAPPVHPLLITNGGTDGFTFPRTLQKWQQNYRPASYDTVVITGGINEVGVIMDTGLSPAQSGQYLHRSMEALRRLIASLIDSQCKRIILIEPFLFPVPAYRKLWLPYLKEVQYQIRRTAGTFYSGRVMVLPVQEVLNASALEKGFAGITTDGIHLTDYGQKILAQIILPHLLPPQS